jgi:hypothetical protein
VALFLALLLAPLALLFVLLEGAARPAVPLALAVAPAIAVATLVLAASVLAASAVPAAPVSAPLSSFAHRLSFR